MAPSIAIFAHETIGCADPCPIFFDDVPKWMQSPRPHFLLSLMDALPGTPLYVSLESALIEECTTTADCTVVEGRILDALGVEDQEGVRIDFNHEECAGRISGLTFEDRSRIASMLEITAGQGVGKVTVLPDPDAEDEAMREGC